MRLSEVSPNTLNGSFSDDLVISKLWLIRKLSGLDVDFSTIYVLGSWFGNLGLLMASKELPFERIINVDTDGKAIGSSQRLCDRLGISDRVSHQTMDANDLTYDDLGTDGLVINTSCNNIKGRGWFDGIPNGTMVALQGRDMDPGSPNQFRNLSAFAEAYPMGERMFSGEITLRDPETAYTRFMLIGRV